MKSVIALAKNKAFLNTAKIVLAVVLLAVVFRLVDWREVRRLFADMNWWYFAAALALQWVVIAIGNHRLQILLRAQEVRLSYWRTLKYNCIGYFFNLALPGGTGGDVVKAVYVMRETKEKKAECVSVILLDRVMGLIAVVAIAALSLALTLKMSAEFRKLFPGVLVLLGLTAVGVVLVATKNYWRRYAWWRALEARVPHVIRRMVNALHEYRAHKATLLLALAESVVLQVIMCVIAWCFGLGLRLGLAWYLYFIIFPILTLIVTIPVTPSGLGVTEGAAAWCFKQVMREGGGSAGIAFMLLLRLLTVNMALVGFVYWILPGTHIRRDELEAEAARLGQSEDAR
ncbi:flippase-like domain-containing protein [bacterium]|nr:flippase-like domain-containing protein [bacterium]